MISLRQLRLARCALGILQSDVAKEICMTVNKFSRLESGTTEISSGDLERLETFYTNSGVIFTDGDGVRMAEETITYRGMDGFRRFMDDVYHVASTQGGELRLCNARPSNWVRWAGEEWLIKHNLRMIEARKQTHYRFRITSKKGDYLFPASGHAEYRWVPDEMFNQQSVYIYGNRLALMIFSEEAVEVFVMRRQEFVNSFISLFDIAWDTKSIIPDVGNHKPADM